MLLPAGYPRAAESATRPQRNDTVTTRAHPDLDPLGIRARGFTLYPKLGYQLAVNDNIFAVDKNRNTDLISVVSPGLSLVSNGRRNVFELSAGANLGRYADFTSEDYDDWHVSAAYRSEPTHQSRIRLGLRHINGHEARQSPDNAGGLHPGIFTRSEASLDLSYQPGLLGIEPIASYRRLNFRNIDSLLSGVPIVIEQDDRNRTEYEFGMRGLYDVAPHRNAYLQVRGFVTDYDKLQDITGFERSSTGYEISVGADLDFGGISRVKLLLGYRRQAYADPLPDTAAPVFDLAYYWKPSELTSLVLDVKREFGETTLHAYSGFVETESSIHMDHELLRNLIVTVHLSMVLDDFSGIGSAEREDRLFTSRVGFKWRPRRNLVLSLQHEYTGRETSDNTIAAGFPDGDFHRHIGWLMVEFQY